MYRSLKYNAINDLSCFFSPEERKKKKGGQENEHKASFNVERDIYREEIPEDEPKSCGPKLSR